MKMQRQSLGSPGSNHHGGVTAVNSPLTFPTEPPKKLSLSGDEEDDEKTKLLKPSHRSSSPVSSKQKKNPEKLIHGIPILTFVCFLILYLSSHDPSQFEMDAFGGFKNRPETTTTTTFLGARSVSGVMEGGVSVAMVERKGYLAEAEAEEGRRKIRVHRKLRDF